MRNYDSVLTQARALVDRESDLIANMANISALLYREFGFWWVGFYRVDGEGLVLGPFQGPLACTRIPFGKGVCGSAWEEGETIIVPDVDEFPGHIACSSESRSEIVVPVKRNGRVIAVLDIDSDQLDAFDGNDRVFLEKVAECVGEPGHS